MSTVLLDARKPARSSWPEGAFLADLERDLSDPGDPSVGGRHPLPSLQAWCRTLGRWGIDPQTHVVVMDDRGGGLAAARAWWMLRAVGHTHVRIAPLSGEMTDVPTPLADGPPYPATRWHWPTVTADQVAERARDPAWRLLDARAGFRHRGERDPYDPRPGHIPGALSLPWESTVDQPDEALRQRISALVGEVRGDRILASCGSGVTACYLLYQLDRLGFGQGALYVGSFSEWTRQGRPVARDDS